MLVQFLTESVLKELTTFTSSASTITKQGSHDSGSSGASSKLLDWNWMGSYAAAADTDKTLMLSEHQFRLSVHKSKELFSKHDKLRRNGDSGSRHIIAYLNTSSNPTSAVASGKNTHKKIAYLTLPVYKLYFLAHTAKEV